MAVVLGFPLKVKCRVPAAEVTTVTLSGSTREQTKPLLHFSCFSPSCSRARTEQDAIISRTLVFLPS